MTEIGSSRTIQSKQLALVNEAEEKILFKILQDKFGDNDMITWSGYKDADFYDAVASIDFKIFKLPENIFAPSYDSLSKVDTAYKMYKNEVKSGYRPNGIIYIETKTRFAQNMNDEGFHIMTEKDLYNFRRQYPVINGKIDKTQPVVKEEMTLFCPIKKMEVFRDAYNKGIACYYSNYLNINGNLGFRVAKYNPSWWNETKYPTVDISITTGNKIYTESYLIPYNEFKPIEEIEFSYKK